MAHVSSVERQTQAWWLRQHGQSRLAPTPRHNSEKVAPAMRAGIVALLGRARYPLSRPVIAAAMNRSPRQTQRALAQLIAAGHITRACRPGEGHRNPLYSLKAAP